MNSTEHEGKRKSNWTIPNILSVFRICLIPVFIWLYLGRNDGLWTAIILIVSALTDIADGYIARHFNMVSDLGKALDPIADKLTQAAMLTCLVLRVPLMAIPLGLMVVKEITLGILSLETIKRTGEVHSARWYGKVTTVLLYATMILHLLWSGMPRTVSMIMIFACVGMQLLSMALYGIWFYRQLHGAPREEA